MPPETARERMATVLQASLMLRHAPSAHADAFLERRLRGTGLAASHGHYGAGPAMASATDLIEHAAVS